MYRIYNINKDPETKKYELYQVEYTTSHHPNVITVEKVDFIKADRICYIISDCYGNTIMVPKNIMIDMKIKRKFYGPLEKDINNWDTEASEEKDKC